MKKQIKNSHKVITGIALLAALLLITVLNAIENTGHAQDTSGSQTRAKSPHIDIRILVMSDKVEALKKFITGWQEVRD